MGITGKRLHHEHSGSVGGSGWVGLNCAVACGVRCSAGVVRVQ